MSSPHVQDHAEIERRRKAAGLNLRTLAEQAGISPQHMSLIASGKRGCSPDVVKRLANVLSCPAEALLTDSTASAVAP
jgi:transcriptional regulator with XRE-family HTH domain